MATKLEALGEIYSDWNERKLTGDQAMNKVHKLFPRATLKAWRKRQETS